MSLTYDLSTNAKWATLAGGTHNVTIIAKADGYENSDPSTAVMVTKESAYKFKHLYDAGTIGTGTIKFRHYSQQEPSSGETWVLNETIDTTSEKEFTVNFNSKDVDYSAINLQYMRNIQLMDYVVSAGAGGIGTTVYSELESGWIDQAYRTITFATAPTGDLLTWLQANGTKQGGGGIT